MAAAATDLLVIGGGPAGLATAIAARLAGMSARVVERSRPPIDKACGEGLMPDAVARLGELGVELPAGEGFRFRGIRYLDGDVVAEGVFPRAGGLGVRRLHLHQALARRAAELGVDLWWGVTVHGLEWAAPAPAPAAVPPGVHGPAKMSGPPAPAVRPATATQIAPLLAAGARTKCPGREVAAARWIVGADGLHSPVRRWAGLEGSPARCRRFGVRRHFACRPWSDMVEVHWGPRCEAYVTPVGEQQVGVAMLWGDIPGGHLAPRQYAGSQIPGPHEEPAGEEENWPQGQPKTSFDRLLAHFPALAVRLAGAPIASRDRGVGPLCKRARAVFHDNVALIGDASGYVDAITGEGLAVALHQSAVLVEALQGGDLAHYGACHRRIGRLPDTMTSLLLTIERRPWLRHRMVRALAAEPALFSRLLGIHARALPPARLGIDGALRLVYRLVMA